MKKPLFIFLCLFLSINAYSQEKKLSDGPFNQLIIRGAILVNGNGSPPLGPVDIVIEKNIIKSIKTCLLYTSPSPRDQRGSRMPSSA